MATLLVSALLYPDFDTSSFFVRQDVAHCDNLTKNNLFYIEKSWIVNLGVEVKRDWHQECW